jgi:autotransporter family porin
LNEGSITSSSANAISLNAGGSILNEGSIISSSANAIFLNADGSVINSDGGLVSGGSRGIFVGGGQVRIQNDGTTTGNTAGGFPAIEIGTNAAANVVINDGTINGDVVFDVSTNDFFYMHAGQLTGRVRMSPNSNETALFENLNDTNMGRITIFHGGGGGGDVLFFNNSQHAGGSEIINWETINLVNNSTLTLNSNLTLGGTSADTTATLNIQSTSILVAMNGVNAVIMAAGRPALVNNAGIVNLSGSTASNTLTIMGDYVGQNGILLLNAILAGDNSPADVLVIDGQNGGSNAK